MHFVYAANTSALLGRWLDSLETKFKNTPVDGGLNEVSRLLLVFNEFLVKMPVDRGPIPERWLYCAR